MNILLRIYFFTGLVSLTIMLLLFAIVGHSILDNYELSKWTVLGIMASWVPILLVVGELVENKSKKEGKLFNKTTLILKSLVISVLLNVCGSLFVSYFYGDAIFRELIMSNATLFVGVIFIIAFLFLYWLEKTRRKENRENK
ncbi:hypothetical protein ACFL17_02215 [Pseudomonadota bacterium]